MKNLYQKLLNIQKEIGAISKDATNPFFKSKYFDVNSLLAELKPLLNKESLVVLQPLMHLEGKPALKTEILDPESGEKTSSITPLPENPDPQKMGAIITYFRRYALQSFFLLQAEDDDGNSAVPQPKAPVLPKSEPTDHPFESRPTKVVGETCQQCNIGHFVKSSTTGKIFCSEKCWTR